MGHLDLLDNRSSVAKQRTKLVNQIVVPPTTPRLATHRLDCFLVAESFAVRTVSHQCVVDVGDLQDACSERNLVAFQSIRIPRPIEFLMMMPNDGQNQAERLQGRADSFTGDWMLFHDDPLSVVECAILEQDVFGYANLPDIVDHAGPAQSNTLFVRQTETLSQGFGVGR